MKLFLLFILGSFMLGILIWRAKWGTRAKIVAGLSAFVCVGYFFLNQI